MEHKRHSQAESDSNQATNGGAEERPDSVHAMHACDLRAALTGSSHVCDHRKPCQRPHLRTPSP